jgi:hypothetical protein
MDFPRFAKKSPAEADGVSYVCLSGRNCLFRINDNYGRTFRDEIAWLWPQKNCEKWNMSGEWNF